MKSTFMKSALIFGFVFVSACLSTAGGSSDTTNEVFNLNSGGTIRLENVNGNITITTWDRNEVEVVAVKKTKGSGDAAQKRLDEVTIEFEEDDDQLSITTIYPKSLRNRSGSVSIAYTIKAPVNANLDLLNTNGKIQVTGVKGTVAAKTTNGKITLEGIRGALQARTTNGGIQAELLEHNGEEIVCATTNGSIRIALPGNIQADLNAKTTNGSIKSDLPLTIEGSKKRTKLSGDINGGGTPIQLRTTNGSISLANSSG